MRPLEALQEIKEILQNASFIDEMREPANVIERSIQQVRVIMVRVYPGEMDAPHLFNSLGDIEDRRIRRSIAESLVVGPSQHWEWQKSKLIDLIDQIDLDLKVTSSLSINPIQQTTSQVVGKAQNKSNGVFIVHGHDGEMQQSVARVIEKFGLKAVILHEQPNAGQTIIEKFEQNSDVGFAVVLLSPDDVGRKHDEKQEDERPRARQNVILELGYFIGKLGRKHVFALKKDAPEFEMPSDLLGIGYSTYDRSDGTWRMELAKELQQAGYQVDSTKL
jgi:predicted nucleotide-binding protein